MSAEMTAVTLCSHNLTFIKYHVIAFRFWILTKYALSQIWNGCKIFSCKCLYSGRYSVNISTTKPEIFINYSYKRDRAARMLLRQHKYKKGQRLSVYNNKSKRLIKRYEWYIITMGNECNYALQTALYKCNIFELLLTYFANNNIDGKFAIFCNIFCKK